MSDAGQAGLEGHPPRIAIGPGNPEALKYGRLWQLPAYRQVAPGEHWAPRFLEIARPRPGQDVIDFGCGTGRGALLLAILGDLRVTMIDFTRNCLDDEIREALQTQPHRLRFLKADLEQPLSVAAPFGFCTDVLEHIPPHAVDQVLNVILTSAQHVFFSISTTEDACGHLINERLHLSIHPHAWWLAQFTKRGARVLWTLETPDTACFYVNAWTSGADVSATGSLNIDEAQIVRNVEENIQSGYPQVRPHEDNDLEVMILGGAPSLNDHVDAIQALRAQGTKLITMNGTYGWALDHGLTPSAQLVIDARPFNARFVRPVVPSCRYLIASQCDPSVLQSLPREQTLLWHTSSELIAPTLAAHYAREGYYIIPGGSTILLRAIPLLRLLGYRKFHLFGCDSCYRETRDPSGRPLIEHHAYPQPENDEAAVVNVITQPDGRLFTCAPWMISQANELLDLIRMLGDQIELAIYGDGLLSHLLQTGAALETENPSPP